MLSWFKRPPDLVIGDAQEPYMLRWYIIPRNRFFNIYLHKFLQSDDARALHDHPWASLGVILKGSYIEHLPADYDKWVAHNDRTTVRKIRNRFRPVYRGTRCIHRVELFTNTDDRGRIHAVPVWTLFMTGPMRRAWGFWCPKGFVHFKYYLAPRDGSNNSRVGRGCD